MLRIKQENKSSLYVARKNDTVNITLKYCSENYGLKITLIMNGNILVMKNENNRNRELLKKMGEFLF
jgi:hypothetical protein